MRTLKSSFVFLLMIFSATALAGKPGDKCWCGAWDDPYNSNQQFTCHVDNKYGDQLCTNCIKNCKGSEKDPKGVMPVPGLKGAIKAR